MTEYFGQDITDTSTGAIAIKQQKICFGSTKDFGWWLTRSFNADDPQPVVNVTPYNDYRQSLVKIRPKVIWNRGVPVANINTFPEPKYVSYLTVKFPACVGFYVYGATPDDMADCLHRIVMYHEYKGNPCKDLFQWAANLYTGTVSATDYYCITPPKGREILDTDGYLNYICKLLKRARDELKARGYHYTGF